ncbi:NUDIX hydrolase [Hydromonas duriensis]|uniref:Phosphatase NudJ n=1 Tax=Hydromonas duriensis TaxID=1527608 RepID=A0A4R6Y6F8_9BURK|nr:NUDIX hydrolase [Hydromonas duriensis]TDR30504.1 ADP-ribose pyrophosphatase YjhB (NUDIX family) [Hydromonas duriensis]
MPHTSPIWTPHATVAAIVERDGRFLMVREHTRHGIRINQPAGHWEADETMVDAVTREVLEESGYAFTPTALLGIYISDKDDKSVTYLRLTFIGTVSEAPIQNELDDDIIAAEWLTVDEIMSQRDIHRNPVVAKCLGDYLAGQRLDLSLVKDLRIL